MSQLKTKSLERIEDKMLQLDEGSLRHRILDSAKNFKTSWIDLGQSLYAAWKDRLYKGWGYGTFEAYTAKEIGIKKQTALKLLKSYSFLEKEEPSHLSQDYIQAKEAVAVPNYESVNALRLAKEKKVLGEDEYMKLKTDVFDMGKDAAAVKKDLTALLRQKEELDPDAAREKRRSATLRRLIETLKSLKREGEHAKLLPASVMRELSALILKIEEEVAD